MTESPPRADTGIEGLDAILGGGLPRDHAYLVEGRHGTGKTTLAMQFLMAGARRGEPVLYLTMTESEVDVREIARSHGWDLDGVTIHYEDPRSVLGPEGEQSVFHSAEVELPRTVDAILSVIERVGPRRLVIDSLTELRLTASDPRWFRRQALGLREDLAARGCTTLFCDDQPEVAEPGQSLVHGVIRLEQLAPAYGSDRRRLRVVKVRGLAFASGYHDFRIRTGGIEVYPRLMAAEHRGRFETGTLSSGVPELDALFGGGVDRGTATLLLGPAGTGKSIVASRFVLAAAQREERAAMYVFDERLGTLLLRAGRLDLPLEAEAERGRVRLQQVDPAEMTPGEFSHVVRQAVEDDGVKLVVIDSLAGYVHAMPDERSLMLHLHELLSFLNQRGVTVLMVMAQHGVPGMVRQADVDLSYVADSVLLFHLFEHAGELWKAISVYKRRGGPHDTGLHELELGPGGVRVGRPLRRLEGLLTGTPRHALRPPGEDGDAA